MREIKYAMCRERHHHNPQRPPETCDGDHEEDGASQRLENECMCRSTYDGKERIVGRDHNRHDWIEGSVAIEPNASGEEPDKDSE